MKDNVLKTANDSHLTEVNEEKYKRKTNFASHRHTQLNLDLNCYIDDIISKITANNK